MKICKGSTRVVFLIGRYAFKVPRPYSVNLFLCGMLGNLQERSFSRLGYKELCPVLWGDPLGLLIIMPRCEPIGPSICQLLRAGQSVHGLKFVMPDLTVAETGHCLPVEVKQDSFGWLNGSLVALDYGS